MSLLREWEFTSPDGLFVALRPVLHLRGWVGRSAWCGRFVGDAGLRLRPILGLLLLSVVSVACDD